MNPLLQDLADSAGHVMAHALNSLPTATLKAIGDAHTAGAEIELRVRAGNPARIALWCVNQTDSTWIATVA